MYERDPLKAVGRLLVLLDISYDHRYLSPLIEVDENLGVRDVLMIPVLDECKIGKKHPQVRDTRRIDAVQVSPEQVEVPFPRHQQVDFVVFFHLLLRQQLKE